MALKQAVSTAAWYRLDHAEIVRLRRKVLERRWNAF